MENHLLFAAEKKIQDEFLLASIAMKAVHRLHRPGDRTAETASLVFTIVAKGRPVEMPANSREAEIAIPAMPEDGLKRGNEVRELPRRTEPPAASSKAA